MYNNRYNKAFSLVELSVVLAIIGLIAASITTGAHLLKGARIQKVIKELAGYKEAVDNFRGKYNALPGDMADATNFWGVYHSSNNPKGTANGDGDYIIETDLAGERVKAWQHLSLSNMITGYYDGLDAGTPDYVIGTTVPGSIIDNGHYFFSHHTDIYNRAGNAIQLGSNESNTSPYGSILLASDAYAIDIKIDDGAATTGELFGFRGNEYDATAGRCVDAAKDQNSANFILTDTVVSCRMWLWLYH